MTENGHKRHKHHFSYLRLVPLSKVNANRAWDTGRPAGASDEISIAPALDTAAAVIILALPLPRDLLPGPKSLKRTTV
jgi:hypothetical protein